MALFSKKDDDPLILMQKGDFKKAMKLIEYKLKKNPSDFNLKIKLGECYEGNKEIEKATETYLEVANEYIKSGDKNRGFAVLKKAEKISPENSEVKEKLKNLEEKKSEEESFSFDIEVEEIKLTEEQEKLKTLLKEIFPIGENALNKIASAFELKEIKEGETLINEGEDGTSLYILLEGEMKVFSKDFSQGKEIGVLKRGEVIGEVSFLKGVKRTATVVAKSNSRVAELSGSKAKEILSPYPQLLETLDRIIEKRVFDLISRLKEEK